MLTTSAMASTTSADDYNTMIHDFYIMVINEVKIAISVCPAMESSHCINPIV
jgi:hypothetical protein